MGSIQIGRSLWIVGMSVWVSLMGLMATAEAQDMGGDGVPENAPTGISKTPAGFDELGELLQMECDAARFSGAVLIAGGDGELVFEFVCGYADKRNDVPNRIDTKFNIGSINKVFTRVAVYQLLNRGVISLGDTIGKFLPEFPETVRNKVTIEHLLNHKSGWGAYWEHPDWLAGRTKMRTVNDYMAFIKDIPLEFEPGLRQQYSNTGFEVLGAIVERASGKDYYDYVREHIFKPAGMTETDSYFRDQDVANRAVGYTGGGYAQDSSEMFGVRGTPAGGGYSTVGDLARFVQALRQGKLLPPKYADRFRGNGFAGGAQGVNAVLELDVRGDHTVTIACNFDPPCAERWIRTIRQMLELTAGGGDLPHRPKYRIGISMNLNDDGVTIESVAPGSAAERAGLQSGDLIVAIDGKPCGDDPLVLLDPAVQTGQKVAMTIRRDGEALAVTIQPKLASTSTAASTSAGQSLEQWLQSAQDRLKRVVEQGFSGSVLLVRGGKIVLHEGYGMADRKRNVPNKPETIYAIGSTPIDFTKAGILLLEQRGKLSTSDRITKYFDSVPEDKRTMTIEHLMTGGSGLQDFPDLPSDPNTEFTWIDRDELVRRVLNQKLLFAPGEKNIHSHSAWGLLAAILEIVSGQSYEDFLREHLLGPAGMTRTGFNGDQDFSADDVAIGYGDMKWGKINSPPHWGRPSWLVQGSGGMVSTVGDLYRWNQAIRSGKILSAKQQSKYWVPPGVLLAGGNEYGFEVVYNEGPDNLFFICCNNGAFRGPFRQLARDFMALIQSP